VLRREEGDAEPCGIAVDFVVLGVETGSQPVFGRLREGYVLKMLTVGFFGNPAAEAAKTRVTGTGGRVASIAGMTRLAEQPSQNRQAIHQTGGNAIGARVAYNTLAGGSDRPGVT
jgi:hypothetical protein